MSDKTKVDYTGMLPTDLFVVWIDGKWRIYKGAVQAYRRYRNAPKGVPAQILRYQVNQMIDEK